MKEITATRLKEMIDSGKEVQIIDIREEHELDYCSIDGEHIPMDEVLSQTERIRKDIPVIIHCRAGERAAAVVHTLTERFGFENVSNLKGGIIAYAEEVDNSLEKY